MRGTQLTLLFDTPAHPAAGELPAAPTLTLAEPIARPERKAPPPVATGEKAKTRDILAAIRALKRIESEDRPATDDERQALGRFGGFGAVALSLFPDPVTGRYKDASWQFLGEEFLTVRALPGWRACEKIEDGLPDCRHARLWRRSADSFFSVPRL